MHSDKVRVDINNGNKTDLVNSANDKVFPNNLGGDSQDVLDNNVNSNPNPI